MINSYTLSRIKPAKCRHVYRTLKTYPEVKELVSTYGEYDLIIKVSSTYLDDLDNFIFNKLRTIDGIQATTTLIEANPTKQKTYA
ncbi:Lrp/AsnC ligand binding domain-containing protein [Candidatus Bathyarchaeota archaeon]|nr:Lrp/AsnC ligand binding domain-containing protein [Candidatus Bathyarchaeota archaeon]